MDSIDYADPETINGLNLYSYCDNNPVMNEDPSGHGWFKSLFKLVAAVALVVAVAAASVVTAGAASVILAGAAIGGAVGMVAGGVTGAVGAAITGGDIFEGFADGAFTGAIVGTVKGAMNAVVPGGGSAGALALTQVGSIVVASASSAVGTVGANILFSKGFGARPGHNSFENKQFSDAMKSLGNFTKKSPEWKIGQRAIEDMKKAGEYIDSFQELVEFLREVLGL